MQCHNCNLSTCNKPDRVCINPAACHSPSYHCIGAATGAYLTMSSARSYLHNASECRWGTCFAGLHQHPSPSGTHCRGSPAYVAHLFAVHASCLPPQVVLQQRAQLRGGQTQSFRVMFGASNSVGHSAAQLPVDRYSQRRAFHLQLCHTTNHV